MGVLELLAFLKFHRGRPFNEICLVRVCVSPMLCESQCQHGKHACMSLCVRFPPHLLLQAKSPRIYREAQSMQALAKAG